MTAFLPARVRGPMARESRMKSSLSPNGLYALALARRGYRVLPCCWPDVQGRCACLKRHTDRKEVGKAPLTHRGAKNASTNAPVTSSWWQRNPEANVAIALAPTLLMLDPDSDDARAECYRNGVPDTLTRISRNNAFIFKAPPGLGNVQLTHKGTSGAIDILNGYCLVYGTHRTGARIFLENPAIPPVLAPAWVLEWIGQSRRETPLPIEFGPDDPPVQLTAGGLEWWRGERTVSGPDGEIDRSATLFQIGLALGRANASAATIVEALAERDAALCYEKYSARKDANTRYAEIAQRVIVGQRAGRRPILPNGHRPQRLTNWEVRG